MGFGLFHFFFFAVALVILGFFAFRLVQAFQGMARCRNWPQVPGRVLHSGVVRRRKLGHKTTSVAHVIYEYEVNGRTYQSDRLHPPPDTGGALWASRKVGQYPIGKNILVSYDPENPAEAVLEKQGPLGLYVGIFVVLLFFFLWKFLGGF